MKSDIDCNIEATENSLKSREFAIFFLTVPFPETYPEMLITTSLWLTGINLGDDDEDRARRATSPEIIQGSRRLT